MNKKKPIHKFSLGHKLLRTYVDQLLYTYYRTVTVVGKENVPKDKPVILAINHQNALMDALTVLCTLKGQPVFMARADIFKNKTAAKVLRFFKILPIYRIRDGVSNLKNNDSVFEEATAVLESNNRLAILPEGTHFGHRRLRILKKGIARIAFGAEERNNFNLDLQIVPVGLDYTNYTNFGGDLRVSFGKPFNLKQFKEEYIENQQKAMNSFMIKLKEEMIPLMLHINDADNYDGIEALKDFYIEHLYNIKKIKKGHSKRINASQQIANQIIILKEEKTEEFNQLIEKAVDIKKNVQKLNLRNWAISKNKYPFIKIIVARFMQLILFPVYLCGFITNIIPFYLPVLLSRKTKDIQFLSSMRFGLSIVTFTLTYLIYLVLLLIIIDNNWIAIAISASIPILGIISFKYYVWYKKTSAMWRVNRYTHSKDTQWINLRKNWNFIITFLDKTIKIKE